MPTPTTVVPRSIFSVLAEKTAFSISTMRVRLPGPAGAFPVPVPGGP